MEITFEPIDSIVQGYRAAQVVLTANRLGLFAQLDETQLDLDQIARGLKADRRGVRILCDALVALSILEKVGERFRNSPVARRFLLPNSPHSRVASLLHTATQYEKWGGLLDSVLSGKPTPEDRIDPRLRFGRGEFAKAMADIGRVSATEVLAHLDLGRGRRMLDIGGGPAVYAIEFARKWPGLTVDVLDDADTLRIASDNVRDAGLSERIRLIPGDALQSLPDCDYDFIFLSNLVHIYSDQQNEDLVSRCGEALCLGGEICVKDFILDPGRTTPPGATLFAVNMLVSTASGDCYTEKQVISWFEKAGIRFTDSRVLTRQTRLVIGRKAAS